MNDKEILEKALHVAVKNGYLGSNDKRYNSNLILNSIYLHHSCEQLNECYVAETNRGNIILGSLEEIIFNHDFNRALWGDELIDTGEMAYDNDGVEWNVTIPKWKYRLQQIVISDNPIKLLGKLIK